MLGARQPEPSVQRAKMENSFSDPLLIIFVGLAAVCYFLDCIINAPRFDVSEKVRKIGPVKSAVLVVIVLVIVLILFELTHGCCSLS